MGSWNHLEKRREPAWAAWSVDAAARNDHARLALAAPPVVVSLRLPDFPNFRLQSRHRFGGADRMKTSFPSSCATVAGAAGRTTTKTETASMPSRTDRRITMRPSSVRAWCAVLIALATVSVSLAGCQG